MDAKIKKCCISCNQFYNLKSMDSRSNANIPLFLACGHSMCENCVRNRIKFVNSEPIICKSCHQDVNVNPEDLELFMQNKISLYTLFPVNVYMIGELTIQTNEAKNYNHEEIENDYFLDIKALINRTETMQGECVECRSPTSTMCGQCSIIVCKNCFYNSHKNYVIFKNHVLGKIEANKQKNTCNSHTNKPLDYYCKDCSKSICMDCMMVGGDKSCKNHNIISIQEVNENLLTDLAEIQPKVDEVFRRLTKTAVDIGHFLTKLNDEISTNYYTILMNKIDSHYSKLFSILQKQKDNITHQVLKLKLSEIDSLKKAKCDIAENIIKAKTTLNTISSLEPDNLKEINLYSVLEEAQLVVKTPWYLRREESDLSFDVTVNEEVYSSLSNYMQLEGNQNSAYKLCCTDELTKNNEDIPSAPIFVVFPPELIKDVRHKNYPKKKIVKDNLKQPFLDQAPKYRSKSGSCSSLNSNNSDHSHNTIQNSDNKPIVETVTPFTENQHPRKLVEGSKELIYISHIVDPHNFYVQRACQQPRVQELIRELRNAVSMPKPSAPHITEGKIYLVFNKADNLWQRCRMMSIDRRDANKPIFHVFCIDFGSTEAVPIDKLRLIPPGRIQSPPPFAINCSLANCEPISGTWTSDDSFLIQKIIDNKQAVIHIRRASYLSSGSLRLECDVTSFEDGVSVAHALAFHSRARIPVNMPYPKIKGVIEEPKLFIGNHDCKKNSIEEVYITHIVSPDNFFVRESHLQPVFQKLCEDLDHEYNINIKTGSIYLPEKNMVCIANIEKCGLEVRWARGVVCELPGRERVSVLLPDIGAVVLLHWTALRRIHNKFTVLRALARECHLAGVTPPHNKKWSPGSVALLQSFQNRLLEMHVEDNRNRNSLGVTLYDKSDDENVICINTQMIKNKFAITFGMYMFNKNVDTDEIVFTKKSPLDEQKPTSKPKGPVTILKKQQNKSQQAPRENLEAKDKGPLRLEAKILNYQSPSLLYVSLVHQQKVFSELFDNLQTYYSKKKTQGKSDWKVGDRCCTFCNQSQTWRRAVILEIENENSKVFYSDFACVETVLISTLREIPQDLASTGDAAIMCHLHGVVPAIGEEWPSLTKEFLKELLDAYNRIFITRLGNFKDKSMSIELWVYHTIQGGALEPNISEWRCLNKKIIEQGLGIPDKSQEEAEKEKVKDSTGDDVLSFLNITGSVQDWLQIEPMPLKPLKIKSDSESNSSTPIDVDIPNEEDPQSSNTVFISDWLPPEPLSTNEFTAMPTYIDNDGLIYLHDISQQDTLDLIRKALDVRFSNPDPKAKFVKWTVGEPCIALFFLDNRFYRGRVLEVNNETSSCLIHYIDYGNEEVCAFENLRKSIALYQIPTQAHKCVLNRIQPVKKHWDRQALDYIHKSIVEKQCYVKVSGEPIGGLTPIELKYDKLWINDHLVDFEMAVYTDGSKAIVRKFVPTVNEMQKLEQSLESDSGPDYLVEFDDTNIDRKSLSDLQMKSLEGKDWLQIMDEEENQSLNDNFMTYSPYTQTTFICNIAVLNELEKLELTIIQDDEMSKTYADMFEELQNEVENLSPLNGIYENKACIAVFPADDLWYRASILQYSEAKKRIKVKYVDYGNIEVISVADVREINEKYARLPPATLTVCLHGVKNNPDTEKNKLIEYYKDTFLEKGPFHAKVIDDTNIIPSVKLRDDNGQLVYENLIELKVLIKCE